MDLTLLDSALGSDKRKRRVNHLAREAYTQRLKGF
jgi:hypothetical protein